MSEPTPWEWRDAVITQTLSDDLVRALFRDALRVSYNYEPDGCMRNDVDVCDLPERVLALIVDAGHDVRDECLHDTEAYSPEFRARHGRLFATPAAFEDGWSCLCVWCSEGLWCHRTE